MCKLSCHKSLALVKGEGEASKACVGGAYADRACINRACTDKAYISRACVGRACVDGAYIDKACIDRAAYWGINVIGG